MRTTGLGLTGEPGTGSTGKVGQARSDIAGKPVTIPTRNRAAEGDHDGCDSPRPGRRRCGKRAIGHWTERAACRASAIDPELFFPVSDSGRALPQVTAAKRICTACPVLTDCLAWALLAGEPAGIWGGTTPLERRVLRAQARRLPPDGPEPWASLVTPDATG